MFVVFSLLLQFSCIRVEASTKSPVTAGNVVFTDPATHDSQLLRLVSDVRMRLRGENVTLKRRPEQSHCPRPHNYKSKSTQLDISEFNKLLKIEYLKENRQLRSHISKHLIPRINNEEIYAVADVQALMNMEQLVRLTSGIFFGNFDAVTLKANYLVHCEVQTTPLKRLMSVEFLVCIRLMPYFLLASCLLSSLNSRLDGDDILQQLDRILRLHLSLKAFVIPKLPTPESRFLRISFLDDVRASQLEGHFKVWQLNLLLSNTGSCTMRS